MKIYNTLTGRKEEFVPIEEGKVRMYVCGPTVYNLIHIGNARPMIIFDVVRRYFEYRGYEVNFVSNFTDVDDKIIKKAIEEGTTSEEVSKRYIIECKKDMEGLNVRPATTHPLATEEIPEIIDLISTLIEKGYAYKADDGTVYYRTRRFKGYGKLSHKNIDDLEGGHRSILVAGEEQKEDPLDFVLWKPKKEGEPYWESPWCDGRPGWHIECSAMSRKYLGITLDIHAGGEDLIFPHHENEIAQSEAANDAPFSHYWMHNGFLNIDNKKMSKSLGNFFTVRDIAGEYDLQVLRFFMLNAHYRNPLNFSRELMDSAKASLDRIITCADNLRFLIKKIDEGDMPPQSPSATALSQAEAPRIDDIAQYIERFETAMDDDFNTADGISAVFELVRYANQTANAQCSRAYLEKLLETIEMLCDILGIFTERAAAEGALSDDEIEARIAERAEAKKAKDFARADAIRDELLAAGVELKDTREGVKWNRI